MADAEKLRTASFSDADSRLSVVCEPSWSAIAGGVDVRLPKLTSWLGLRFTADWLCPAERFQRLRRELGTHFEGMEIDSSKGNPHGIRRGAHSVLTTAALMTGVQRAISLFTSAASGC